MHRSTNECRTVHSGAVNRLAFNRNTHDPADRQSHHARTHDRQPHHARAHDDVVGDVDTEVLKAAQSLTEMRLMRPFS